MDSDGRLASRIYINGRWHTGLGGPHGVINPRTGHVFAEVTQASEAPLHEAASAARDAATAGSAGLAATTACTAWRPTFARRRSI
jgi:acyl-CoA reductase-like NAD-dependent aldehyde dehydrogenase